MLVIATQCAGIVISGANAAYTPKELEHQLHDSGASVLMVHPSILEVALAATGALGWSKKKQRESIVLAVQKDETGPAGDSESISRFGARLRLSGFRRSEMALPTNTRRALRGVLAEHFRR